MDWPPEQTVGRMELEEVEPRVPAACICRQREILLTLQERRSRLTFARRLPGKNADITASNIAEEPSGLPARARRTITHDNGGGFARHEEVTAVIGMLAFFCDPHSPWHRGSIENAKGSIRRDLPRKTSLAGCPDDDIDDVTWNLNSTPAEMPELQNSD